MFLVHPDWKQDLGRHQSIWQQWWSRTDRETELCAEKIVTLDGFLPQTNGELFIRQYYHDVYGRIVDLLGKRKACGGVVLSGQPGTGKTYSLYFLLLKKLVRSEPVLFLPSFNGVYYFASGGVQYHAIPLPTPDMMGIQPYTWTLINSDEGNNEPPPSAFTDANSRLFLVQATSPRSTRYATWVKQLVGVKWCATRWSRKELETVLKLHINAPMVPETELTALLDQAIRRWGWSPRDVLLAVCHGHSRNDKVLASCLEDLSLAQILPMFKRTKAYSMQDPLFHVFISVYQESPHVDIDDVTVDFKSAYIRSSVQHQFDRLPSEEAQTLAAYCRAHKQSTLLAGWVFEAAVADILCNVNHTIKLPPPVQATAASSPGIKWVLQRSPDPRRLQPLSSTSLVSVHQSSPPPASPSALTLTYFDKTLEDVTLDDTKLYVPVQYNFPLLDAFYLRLNQDEGLSTVVVLQMTISVTHKGSSRGYGFLKTLKTHFETFGMDTLRDDLHAEKKPKRTWKIAFEYHLVVPAAGKKVQTITWDLPAKIPQEIDGLVYVQDVPSQVPIISNEEDEAYFDLL